MQVILSISRIATAVHVRVQAQHALWLKDYETTKDAADQTEELGMLHPQKAALLRHYGDGFVGEPAEIDEAALIAAGFLRSQIL